MVQYVEGISGTEASFDAKAARTVECNKLRQLPRGVVWVELVAIGSGDPKSCF